MNKVVTDVNMGEFPVPGNMSEIITGESSNVVIRKDFFQGADSIIK